jgi:hypothetical protein
MGLQIRAYVDGNQEFIELFGNEQINMEISFAEIQDITKKNSTFTQEFKCPGSKNNNYIFNYFFDINSVALDWNPKKKFEADLLYDGYEIYNGYVRMNSVTINKIEKIYSITFYASVGDLVANIGDKGLCELNTSEIDYPLSAITSNQVWLYDGDFNDLAYVNTVNQANDYLDFSISIYNKDVELVLAQKGYDYTGNTYGTILDIDTRNTPILSFSGVPGFFDYSDAEVLLDPLKSNAVNMAYLIPSVRIGKLYEMICNQAGYQIDSQFFQTSYFRRMYLPLSFNTESVYMSQAKKYRYDSFNESGLASPLGYENTNIRLNVASPNLNVNYFTVGQVLIDNMDLNPYTLPVVPDLNGLENVFFQVPESTYDYSISVNTIYTGATTDVNELVNMGKLYFTTYERYYDIDNISIVNTLFSANTEGNRFRTGRETINTFTGTTSSSDSLYGSWAGLNYLGVFVDDVASDFTITDITISLSATSISLPQEIILSKEMSCEVKQMDIIQNINKMFNFVVIPHPIKPKTLIVEPMINYIGKGETLDWTDKVDFNSPITLTPTTSLINGSLFFANKPDKDLINIEYTKRSNLVFGQNIINLGEDYKNQQTDMSQKTLGQNTDYYLNASGSTNIALPCYFISKQSNKDGQPVFEYRPFRSMPRVTFKGVPINNEQISQNAWYFRFGNNAAPVGYQQNYNRFTTYPFGLSGFSHYLTYDASNKYTDDELIFPTADTMYDVFYRDYIEDLISPENKILNCKMYLQPWEISQLYFNETIVVKNAKWRINKITGLSLLGPGMCNVELVKLTKDYTDFPIKFYDLVPCGGTGSTIHTHTDLNYHIYAMVGSIVKAVPYPYTVDDSFQYVDAQNYTVREVEFNSTYFYQKPYFVEYFDGFSVDHTGLKNYSLFSGECSGTTTPIFTLPIYSDLPTEGGNTTDGEPYNPTPPPPPTTNCYSYTAILATGQGNFFYYDCDGVYTVGTVGPYYGGPTSVDFCALEGSVSGRQPTFINNGPCSV